MRLSRGIRAECGWKAAKGKVQPFLSLCLAFDPTRKLKQSAGKRRNVFMQSTPKQLLVVDDEPDILEFLQVILQEEGYKVVTSDKGGSLESLYNGGLPDLILIDVLLSGKDGREMVKFLKSQQETKQI